MTKVQQLKFIIIKINLKKYYESSTMDNCFLASLLRFQEYMNPVIASLRYFIISIIATFRVEHHHISANMSLWTYNGPTVSLETLLQHDRENWFNMVKPIHSLSSVQPESYRGIILFLFDNIKIISIREQDLSLIGRNPEWRFEIPNLQRSSHYSSSSGRDRTGKSIQSKGIDSE